MRCVLAFMVSMTFGAQAIAQAPDELQSPVVEDELSELDALSRNADDPFAGVIAAQQREPVSVTLRALNKITARYTDIEIEMNQIARFGSLELQPRTCDKRPPEEFPETTAFLEVFDLEYNARVSDLKIQEPVVLEDEIEVSDLDVLPGEAVGELPSLDQLAEEGTQVPAPEVLEGPQAEGVNIFRGWMFASSPALNALEHAVYDVWVIDCKTRVVSN